MIFNNEILIAISVIVTAALSVLLYKKGPIVFLPIYSIFYCLYIQDIKYYFFNKLISTSTFFFLIYFIVVGIWYLRQKSFMKIELVKYLIIFIISNLMIGIFHFIKWGNVPQDFLRVHFWALWGGLALFIDFEQKSIKKLIKYAGLTSIALLIISFPQTFLFSVLTEGGSLGRFTFRYTNFEYELFKKLFLIVINKDSFLFQIETKASYLIQVLLSLSIPLTLKFLFERSIIFAIFYAAFILWSAYLNQFLLMYLVLFICITLTMIFFYIKNLYRKKIIIFTLFIGPLIVVLLTVPTITFSNFIKNSIGLEEKGIIWSPEPMYMRFKLKSIDDPTQPSKKRLSLLQLSINSMVENQMVLFGSGESYQKDGKLIVPNSKGIDLKTDHSYLLDNYFSFGIVGFIVMLFPYLYLLKNIYKKIFKLDLIHFSILLSVLVVIILQLLGTWGVNHIQQGFILFIHLVCIKIFLKEENA